MKRFLGLFLMVTLVGAATGAVADDAKPTPPAAAKPPTAKPPAATPPAAKPTPPADQPPTAPKPPKPAKPRPPAEPQAPTSAGAEVKVGTGYEKHAVAGEAATFPAKTKVFAVSTVTGVGGTTVKHVWKLDGAEIWSAPLTIGSNKWTTSTRRVLNKPGKYEVDVVGADGAELGKVEFTIE